MVYEMGRPIVILLVEDSPTDVLLAREGLKNAKIHNTLHVVEDGIEAMAFLRNQGKYKEAVRPDLILLDLNLPRMDGREVLKEIKSDDRFKIIPVVVLTTSKEEADVLKAYNCHANCYITKPVEFDHFVEIIRKIEDFWFTIVTLPTVMAR